MNTPHSNRYAVVADARSLMRDLLRFLLEQEGFSVVSETSTAAAAVEAVAEHQPDVVILHEATAQDDPEVLGRIRAEGPGATLVILTADRSGTPASLTAAADAVVEEGAGLQDLASVLAAGAGATAGRWTPRPGPRPDTRSVRAQRWADRLQGAVAASILMLAVAFATSVQPAPVESLRAAYASLDVLAAELPGASVEEAVTLATTLISERAMLTAASVDVSALDADIAETIPPILTGLSPDVALALREVLGDLLVEPSPTPTPSPSETPTTQPGTSVPGPGEAESPEPEAETTPTGAAEPPATSTEPPPTETPSPSESPSPTTTESPSPSPSESPSPTTTESPSPSPSESPSPTTTESPSPSETTTPTDPPSPTATGERAKGGNRTIAVVPPGLMLLLGSSGAARWLRRRRG
jgi:CheY-like chemotaxis protein